MLRCDRNGYVEADVPAPRSVTAYRTASGTQERQNLATLQRFPGAPRLAFLFVLSVGLIAGTISGIVGTGSSIMLMPVLVYAYGPKEAVPIMAVASVMANFSRILAWWREVDWRACAAYSVTGIPAAVLGARTLLALPSHAVDLAIGLFLIAMVPVRHWLARHDLKANLWQNFSSDETVSFGTDPIVTNLKGTSLEVGGGITVDITEKASLFATADYTTNLGGERTRIWEGNIGLNVKW